MGGVDVGDHDLTGLHTTVRQLDARHPAALGDDPADVGAAPDVDAEPAGRGLQCVPEAAESAANVPTPERPLDVGEVGQRRRSGVRRGAPGCGVVTDQLP